MKLLRWYFGSNLLIRILIGLVAGSLAGILSGPDIAWVSPLSDVFVRLLKFIVMPVVVFTLVVGAASIHPARQAFTRRGSAGSASRPCCSTRLRPVSPW
ncbi:MAG: cation:dicarboxylase symporter family transporter [Desulfobacterales bacterium]